MAEDSKRFKLRAVDRPKIYVSIVDQILEGIRSGAFPPGSPLPAERFLAAEFDVSRGSLREAIRVLEHAGCLEVRTGNGTFVSQNSLSKAMRLRTRALLLGDESPLDVVVARRAIEPMNAKEAALHRHERDVEALRKTCAMHAEITARDAEALRQSNASDGRAPQSADAFEIDLSFHVLLADATRNPVLEALMETLVAVMRQPIWHDVGTQIREGEHTERLAADHHAAILDAVERRDGEAAESHMLEHLDDVERGVMNLITDD